MSGYTSTPLAKKLGIKAGFHIRLIGQPAHYFEMFTTWPHDVTITYEPGGLQHLIHYFTNNSEELFKNIPLLRQEIFPNGMIWVSWYKKASKMPTDITEDLVRQVALLHGLVDVKVCSVDDQWSGLKLVIPLQQRP